MTLKVRRALPPRLLDGNIDTESMRGNGYGEQLVGVPIQGSNVLLADEGSYLIGLNPTPGTGVAGHAAPTTMDNTKPFLLFRNKAEAGGKRVYLDYIKLVVTAAGTAGTLNYATHLLDAGAGYTSGGSALTVACPNGELNPDSGIDNAFIGAVVATANAALQRVVAHQRVRTVIPVVGDVILFQFGKTAQPGSAMPLEGTTELERVIHCPPVIVAPGQWYKLVLWRASQSAAASYEVEMGYYLR